MSNPKKHLKSSGKLGVDYKNVRDSMKNIGKPKKHLKSIGKAAKDQNFKKDDIQQHLGLGLGIEPDEPKDSKVVSAPMADDALKRIEMRREEALRRKRTGVQSTILTGSNKLG